MRRTEEIDLLFRTMQAQFFSIPARQPAWGPVTFAQMRVLWVLERKGAITLGELARTLGVSRPTITELVDHLAAGRHVRRTASARDRRQAILELLPNGRRILAEHAARRLERFRRLRKDLGQGDLERMARALETLNGILSRWHGRRV
jgi:DNA-binding MarR family transcriptional regulator